MYPSKATMYLAPFTDEEYYNDKVNYWKNVYGIDFSAIMYLLFISSITNCFKKSLC